MGWSERDIPDLSGRTALVTGANSGLGLHVSRALAQHGARVLMGARDRDRGEAAVARVRGAAPLATVELVDVDLGSLAAVRAAAEDVRSRTDDRLDLLFANAGVMAVPRRETSDGFELQLGTNHLGHFALVGQVLPALLAAPAARVVSTSSQAHRSGRMDFDDLMGERSYSRFGAYGQSKLANLLFTAELQRRLAASGARATAVAGHPGWSATDLQAGATSGVRVPGARAVMGLANRLFAQSDAAGALPLLRAGTDPAVEGGDYLGPDGRGEMRGAPVRVGRSERAESVADAQRLWAESERLTGVVYELPVPA
ncbi:oxidoreductase [Pseudokineococcus marinus]|uniref:SDR family oxidoreductase n=1 Tax=Pseudokineococcus marinus TaxID=351215 RepID=A0A849BTK9_9ACTN|nr:oxidoreductase [Pseudokineococcus marinus]NNH24287.1 SDR family oxidoreductase [Pseudokineococcus marinus]